MRIVELLAAGPTISCEFFPPKSDAAADELLRTIERMRILRPSFVSITYGAGGSSRERSVGLVRRIKAELGLEVMAHVACLGQAQAELARLFDELAAAGIENVLALRGDRPRAGAAFAPVPDGFEHADQLIAHLGARYGFCIGAAAYPETHVEAPDAAADLRHVAGKVAAGASFLVTQLFFDNDAYFGFVERARTAGITVPIVPGIMPITNYEQLARFTMLCGATIPTRLRAELDVRADDPAGVAELGVAFATLQCADLLGRGAPGLHFYTLNKSPATRAIVAALRAEALAA